MTQEMVQYYAERAGEYDRVYERPPWQTDVATLKRLVPAFFVGRRVFEAACGTGYWTQYVARTAQSVYATDVNDETLALARARHGIRHNVTFKRADAYASTRYEQRFDAGLAMFWLSHVDLARMPTFLDAFHSFLAAGAPVLMVDERETPERRRRSPASHLDEAGNRYETRVLASAARFEIVKNFYDGPRLVELFAPYGQDSVYEELEHFWTFTYRARA